MKRGVPVYKVALLGIVMSLALLAALRLPRGIEAGVLVDPQEPCYPVITYQGESK